MHLDKETVKENDTNKNIINFHWKIIEDFVECIRKEKGQYSTCPLNVMK